MSDKYGSGRDYYCYEDSNVLVNLLDIRDAELLTNAETDFSNARISEYSSNLTDLESFNSAHFLHLHRVLFRDIYSWAGELRTVDISKDKTRFCTCSSIEREMNKALSRIPQIELCANKRDLVVLIADIFCDLNMVHPFREGNGRTTRLFFEELLHVAGYRVEWPEIPKEEWILANVHGVYGHMEKMEDIFDAAITDV